jgi:hypothetical protein
MWAVAEVSWADSTGNPIRSRATIVDISTSGACIRLRDRIGVGSRLMIRWHREQFSATARNCRRDGADYLLGVRRDSAPMTEAVPSKVEPAPARAQTLVPSETTSVPVRKAVTVPEAVPAATPAPMRESAPRGKAIRSPVPEKRAEVTLKKSPRLADSDLREAQACRDAARQERKVMQPKRLFPNFWRRQHEADAPTQVAPKESPVNKPNSHAVEHVSDPPDHLLSYDDIYHAAGIMNPRSGYGIRKVVEMLNSERIRDLSKDIKRASILMALDAAGASADDLLQDATRRQQALNAYEDGQRKQLEEFEARKAGENAQIETEMQRITAHYAERIQQNQEEVTKHKEALHNWQMAKQHENRRITEVIELCAKQPAAVAGTEAMAATAGAGVGATGSTTVRASMSGDASKNS